MTRAWLRAVPLLLLCTLAACGGGSRLSQSGVPNYAPPGPAQDPWGPYIREASARFDVPERWIRAVIRQESGGHEFLNGRPTTSDAGAMGLMQIMPATYEELRARYGLGDNPYNPHDNILAGTAYIRELYDRYGAPGFLAAYNAGPQRLEDFNAGRASLPNETIGYLASVGPSLGNERPLSGPLAVYATGGGAAAPVQLAANGCDPDAAFDPNHPCHAPALPPAPLPAPAPAPVVVAQAGCWRDPNAAYDPTAPCGTPPARAPIPQAAPAVIVAATAGCWHDPNAAYDPSAPCGTPPPPASPAPVQVAEARRDCWRDPDAAYDAPCGTPPARRAPVEIAEAPMPGGATRAGTALWGSGAAAPPPMVTRTVTRMVIQTGATRAPASPVAGQSWSALLAARTPPSHPAPLRLPFVASAVAAEPRPHYFGANWGVQVGAFDSPQLARAIAESSRRLAPQLAAARTMVGVTAPFGGHVLYRARLTGLTEQEAASACRTLSARAAACITVPPGG